MILLFSYGLPMKSCFLLNFLITEFKTDYIRTEKVFMLSDLQNEILTLKKEKDIAIVAHSYQAPEILEIADITGDSFALSVAATKLSEKTVVMCGVGFMADTVKILSPEKRVILAKEEATCPMAEQISPDRVIKYRKEHPDHMVVAYVNTTTTLKAVADVCVTSSSALEIVKKLPAKDILFIPDKNLGNYVKKMLPEKNIILWDGMCPVHGQITGDECLKAIDAHPEATVLMHPELPEEVLRHADVIGSTAAIIKYALEHDEPCMIGTEKSICDYLSLKKPQQKFYLLSKNLICPDMRITTLLDVKKALNGIGGREIEIEETLLLKAKHAIDEMIRLG